MNNPLLSICIATYNRAEYIGETLDSIIPQLQDDMELLIVDGASTDNTGEVVQRYTDDRIRYIRLPAKGGVDQDYSKAVDLARGAFCWLFTDDDLLKPGAIAAVREGLREGHGLIVVNAEIRDRQLKKLIIGQRISMPGNRTYAPGEMERLFIEAVDYIGFIGSVVIRRNTWLNRDPTPYFGTEFVHVGVIFQKPLTESVLIIADPLITIRLANAQWTPRGFDIWMFKWPKLVWSFDWISSEAKSKICRREPWRSIITLLIQRSLGAYSFQTYRQSLSAASAGPFWRPLAWLIAVFPRRVILILHYLYSRTRGPEARAFFDAYIRW